MIALGIESLGKLQATRGAEIDAKRAPFTNLSTHENGASSLFGRNGNSHLVFLMCDLAILLPEARRCQASKVSLFLAPCPVTIPDFDFFKKVTGS